MQMPCDPTAGSPDGFIVLSPSMKGASSSRNRKKPQDKVSRRCQMMPVVCATCDWLKDYGQNHGKPMCTTTVTTAQLRTRPKTSPENDGFEAFESLHHLAFGFSHFLCLLRCGLAVSTQTSGHSWQPFGSHPSIPALQNQ